ncbi:MAG TPA: aminotransferase class IV [Bryobacteraceae bacterium]|nr:aminotransferase class IV [Bryobacteraceae bacterium]
MPLLRYNETVIHRHILFNDQVRDSSEKLLAPGQVGLLAGWGVFSTIRVLDGVLFAFERHWARMVKDAALFHVPMPCTAEEGQRRLLELVEANRAYNASLRVVVVRNDGSVWAGPSERRSDLMALTSDLHHWGRGVNLALIPNARHAASPFAGTKILSWAMNLTWVEEAQAKGLDEVILLNERGEVSECTSANIFIARGNQVWTPPVSSGCLPGVTRSVLLEEVHVPGFAIGEKVLLPAELESADEVFITSTTRELLPVLEIEGKPLKQGDRARHGLQAEFSKYVERYVAEHRTAQAPAR